MGPSDSNDEIPGMNLEHNYSSNKSPLQQNSAEVKKELDKKKKELDKIRDYIVKKYDFTLAIGILPPQVLKDFIEEEIGENLPKEEMDKLMKKSHLYMIVPEDNYKEIPKIKTDIIQFLEKQGKKDLWLYVKTPVDIWENCFDSKFEIAEAIALSYPVYDQGFLGALRLATIHKSLVLQKFDKYVVSYVLVGSFFRGNATPTSDIDVNVIINDTDVKRMPRLELKERLRSIIYQFVSEAIALAGVKNTLHIQTYLLTDFWEAVKDANPVMFTFIRDGIPIYDKGTFMPWKALLKMGKLKPSPESIDMFMRTAEKTKEMIDRRLMEAMIDVYYGVLNPSQAMLMLHGLPPPTHKETPALMEKIFVNQEKMLKKSEIAILHKAVGLFKEYEHEKLKKISGKEIDELVKASEIYFKRLKELRKQIEKRYNERTIEQIYNDVLVLLKSFIGKKGKDKLVENFEKNYVLEGKFSKQDLRILKELIEVRNAFKKGKADSHKIDEARRDASILINDLIEYSQRCELADLERGRMMLKSAKGKAEVIIADGCVFLFFDNKIKKISDKIEEVSMEQVTGALNNQKGKESNEFNPRAFDLIRKEIGDFEVVL